MAVGTFLEQPLSSMFSKDTFPCLNYKGRLGFLRAYSSLDSSTITNISKLRRQTSMPLKVCKEALTLNKNIYKDALEWLNCNAKTLGYEKLNAVSGRRTLQGLVTLSRDDRYLSIVEVRCESDFVSNNKEFIHLTESIGKALMTKANKEDKFKLKEWHPDEVLDIKLMNGNSIKSTIAESVGKLGENISLNRLYSIVTPPEWIVGTYIHNLKGVSTGTSCGWVGIIGNRSVGAVEFANRLATHIVGFKPVSIVRANKYENPQTILYEQSYLFDQSISVKEAIDSTPMISSVVDFGHYKLGDK
ncbi:hypothetical protein ROZALSC1DRAFT_28710 [Rozella allomycis CSF55]|uniref:Elongation factor Ts, mitochondrial n=1 Tax=Rozella allomycis (strain CSF55) TaxID=988480 RepID=A0A4P9YJX3_ROZAC|nr:hypothetical protein ROZALSC1DRAFT_28710 [Rozella allomycis CSF55]